MLLLFTALLLVEIQVSAAEKNWHIATKLVQIVEIINTISELSSGKKPAALSLVSLW